MKKIIALIICLTLVFSMSALLASCNTTTEDSGTNTPDTPSTDNNNTDDNGDEPVDQQALDYASALAAIESGDYATAKALFEKLGDYKDAATYLSKFYYMPVNIDINNHDEQYSISMTYNDNNLPETMTFTYTDAVGVSTLFYDANGNIIKEVYVRDGNTNYYEYYYNLEGWHMFSVYYEIDGTPYLTLTNRYNADGKNTQTSYDMGDSGTVSFFYEYDENGNLIYTKRDAAGEVEEFNVTCTFDENGNLIREVYTSLSGGEESRAYTYDENGRILTEVLTSADGSQEIYEYVRDENGSFIEMSSTKPDGTVNKVEFEYTLLYIPTGITKAAQDFFDLIWYYVE